MSIPLRSVSQPQNLLIMLTLQLKGFLKDQADGKITRNWKLSQSALPPVLQTQCLF